VICGQWLETGVHSTMRSANDRGYECLLALDACVPYDPDLVPAARSQVEMSGGIFGAVGETAAVLAALHAVSTPDQNLPERTPA
jgi:nicotinamidase-related amidase